MANDRPKKISAILGIIISHLIFCDSHIGSRLKRNVGGFSASIKDYPYMASVRQAGGHICGGTILSESVILTAGHCILPYLSGDLLYVKVGDADINYKGLWHKVTKTVRHEEYYTDYLNNDVALLKLASPIILNNTTTKAVELFAEDDNVQDYTECISIGWGVVPVVVTDPHDGNNGSQRRKKAQARTPSKLRVVHMNIGSKKKCAEITPHADLEGQFCTYTLGKNTCNGDSGGPVMIDGRQAGIVSWGLSCIPDMPTGYYVDVAKYRKWIDEHMKILQESN